MKRIALTLAAVLAFAPLALAHGGVEHLRGTVTQISAKSITIQTQEKQTKTIALLSDTTFEKSGAAAALEDVKVGDRVVVDMVMKGKEMTAKAVKLGAAPANPHK